MSDNDKAYDTLRAKVDGSNKAKGVLRRAGYARGGGVGSVSKCAAGGKIKSKTMKYADGGKVGGTKGAANPGKPARGGSKPKGHKAAHTKININVGAAQQEKQQALRTGVQLGAKLAASKMAGAPRPMAGAPMQARPMPPPPGAGPGGPPPGAMPPPPPGPPPMKRGGKVGPKKVAGVTNISSGGAGGAKGRMEKISKYGSKAK